MTADLAQRLRSVPSGDPFCVLADEAADAIDSLTSRLAWVTRWGDDWRVRTVNAEARLAVAEAERDNLVIAVTRCNDEHVLKSDLAAAEAECVAFAEVQQRHHDKLDAAERVVEIARTLDTCNLTPCAPCICSHHPWAGPLDHEAMCDDLRGELAEFDRLEKAYTAKERANKCDCDFCTPSGCRCCQGPRRGFVGRSENLNFSERKEGK